MCIVKDVEMLYLFLLSAVVSIYKIMFLEFDFEVKIYRTCGLYLFLCIQQPARFHLL